MKGFQRVLLRRTSVRKTFRTYLDIMEQYISKAALMAEIENIEADAICQYQSDKSRYAEGSLDVIHRIKHLLDTLEVKEVDVSNISENLAGAYEYLGYTTTGNLVHNKPMVSARLKKAVQGLFDARLFELTHDKKYRMESLGLNARKEE